jgi:hypothetical protein
MSYLRVEEYPLGNAESLEIPNTTNLAAAA